jgi:hypothetical protein
VRKAFTSVRAVDHPGGDPPPFLVVEHNPQLYGRARDMAGHVAEAMLSGLSVCILLYAPALDRHLEAMAEYAVPWSSASITCIELG